jgi:hypothetical protein
MTVIRDLDEVYEQCVADGTLQEPEDVDVERAKTLLENAELDYTSFKEFVPVIEKKGNFGLIWRIY